MQATGERSGTIGRVRCWVAARRGWRRAGFAFAAGGTCALAFAPMFAAPVLFLSFPVLVWLIDSARGPRAAAFAGWWFGFGYFFFNLFWIGEAFLVESEKFAWLLPFAITLLPATLALFWAAAAAIARIFWTEGVARVLVLAIAISGFEWLRGHVLTGFPWNLPGYALTYPDALMQSAALFGAYGLTAIAIAIAAAPLVILGDRSGPVDRAGLIRAAASALVPLALLAGYGVWRLSGPETFVDGVMLRVVQPSVPQRQKWMPEYQRQIFDDHLMLSVTKPGGERDAMAGITHLVWPEAAMPFFPLEHPEALQILATVIPEGVTLITGALRHDPKLDSPSQFNAETKTFNSLMVLDHEAKPVAIYDKIRLVPGGEFIPFESVLEKIGIHKLTHGRGSFAAGPTPRPILGIPGLPPALGLICYEALFPGRIVEGTERPGVLINVTNDGWFGHSTGPFQHFHQSRVRAVEEGLPLIRAANNGISAVVDAHGRILHRLDLDVRGAFDSRLPAAVAPTLYSRIGDFAFLAVLAAMAIVVALQRNWSR